MNCTFAVHKLVINVGPPTAARSVQHAVETSTMLRGGEPSPRQLEYEDDEDALSEFIEYTVALFLSATCLCFYMMWVNSLKKKQYLLLQQQGKSVLGLVPLLSESSYVFLKRRTGIEFSWITIARFSRLQETES